MENKADFTQKELCLLLKTICREELGVHIAKNVKDLRKEVDVFKHCDTVHIKRVQNKQGTTRVSVFITQFCDDLGNAENAYTATI